MAVRQSFNPDFSQKSQVRPIASPTGAFVRPEVDKNLKGLVEGLSAFQPSLQRFSQDFQRRDAQEKQAEGVEAARDIIRKGLTLAEATREGKLPQQDNPWFMAGFHEKMGQAAADRWHTQAIEDMAKNEDLQQSTSTQDAEDFLNTHKEEWIQKNAPKGRDSDFWRQGFGSRADARTQDEMVKFASGIESRLTKQSATLHFAQVKDHVEKEFVKGTTEEEIARGINDLVSTQFNLGTREKLLDDTTIEAVVAAAMNIGEDKALKVLDHVLGSKTGASLSDLPHGAEALDKARQDIRNRRWIQQERDNELEKRRRSERVNSVLGDAMMKLHEDPTADLKPFIPLLKDEPEALQKLVALNNSNTSITQRTDEEVRKGLFSRIYVFSNPDEQTEEEDVVFMRGQNKLTTEDAMQLISQIRSARESGLSKQQGIWGDFQFKSELGDIEGRFQKILGQFETPIAQEKAVNAKAMFMDRWQQLNANGGISPDRKGAWLRDTAEEVIKHVWSEDPIGKSRQGRPAQFQVPKNVEANFPQELVVDPGDLNTALSTGTVPESIKQKYEELGLKTSTERKAFLKSQLKMKVLRDSGNTQPAPKEE